MRTFEIRGLDCFANKEEVNEVIKRNYLDVINLKVGITSVSSRGQKMTIATVSEKTAQKQ